MTLAQHGSLSGVGGAGILEDPRFLRPVTNFLIMLGGMLVAVQLRLTLPYGDPLLDYDAMPLLVLPILLVSVALGMLAAQPFRRFFSLSPARTQLVACSLGVTISFFLMLVLLSRLSLLQLAYYVAFAMFLSVLVIGVPARALRERPRRPVVTYLRLLMERRALLSLWVTNNVRARYSATALGIAWIILLPTLQSLIFAFVFSQVLRVDVGDTPFIVFFLSALVPYTFFSQGSINSATALTNYFYLINQIYFPRELLVLVKLGELIVDTLFTAAAVFVISLVAGVMPTVNYIYLPILVFISLTMTFGMMLILSYLTVLIRDVPQLIVVVFQMLFYLTPVLYPLSFVPDHLRFITVFNPLVPLIQAYRDIIAYGRAPDLVSLHYPFVIGLVMLYVGYVVFKGNERRLTDFI
jgi:ABC-2 type transport system permease protein